jgi:hypothetical protein
VIKIEEVGVGIYVVAFLEGVYEGCLEV